MSMFKKFELVFFLILFLILMPTTFAFGQIFQWAGTGNLIVFASDNGPSADPMAILPSLGFSLSWHITGPLRIEVTEDIYIANYEYNPLGYPMACNLESSSTFVMGFVTAVMVTGHFPLGENGTTLRVYGGPAADLRIVALGFGINHPNSIAKAQQDTDAIRDYFWSEARWFLPVVGAGMDFPLTEKLMIGFDLRVWMPAYRIWTNEDIPDIDGWRFGLGLRITPR